MIGAALSLAGVPSVAQPQPADPANLLAYLIELEKGSWQYVKDKNIVGLQNYLADDALLIFGDGARYSKAEFLKIVPDFKLVSLAIDARSAEIKMLRPDVATVLYRVTYASALRNANAATMKAISASTYVRRGGSGWRALSGDPIAMKILVIHGAGMNMRGKAQVEIFGPMKLPEYDAKIRAYAHELGVEVEIFHSNIEGEVINRLYAAHDEGIAGAIINPAGYTRGYPALVAAIGNVRFPTIEVHISNPARRGTSSEVATTCLGAVAGFGIAGYALALRGLKERAAAKA